MKKMFAGAFVIPLVLGCIIVAGAGEKTPGEMIFTFNNLEIRTQLLGGLGWYLSGTQEYRLKQARERRDRSYSFYSTGILMVFIGTDDYDRMSRSTGSRTFQLFPRGRARVPSYNRKDDATVEALLPDGRTALFSTETGELEKIGGFTVTTTPICHIDCMVKKRGGVEIRPEKGSLLIDYGWRTGESARSLLWNPSTVYDGYGNRCTIKNSDISSRDPKDPDEVIFRFDSDEDLAGILRVKCPRIVWRNTM